MTSTISFFTWLFFASVFLIFYAYVVFPAILAILSRNRKLIVPDFDNIEFSPVSIVISVYNEEGVIGQKLESILDSNYPKDKIEIIIGSDASDDGTCSIVRSLMEKHSCIKLYEFPTRRGKPSVLNDLVAYTSHPVIFLTDANVIFEKNVIHKLTRHFSNEKTGLVGANILNIGMKKDGISIQEKSYIERENLIKYREGVLWGCMMGPFGGCYAMRKNLFENIPPGFLVDDFYISMKVIEKNFICINDLEAICYEDVPNDIRQEYKRKSRISAGNFQNLKTFAHFLLKPFSAVGFCFISHKFLRWMTPFLILFSFISLVFLSFYNNIYLYLLAGEILLILSPLIDWIAGKMGIHLQFLRFISYFSFMNLALLRGFFKFVGGINSGVWTPTRRMS